MKNKKFFAVILALVLLFAVTFVMSACGDDNGQGKTTETDAETEQKDPVSNDELKVSFDENKTYAAADAEAIASELDAEIVSDGVSRKVEFNVKSTEVTEDGEYIKVTVSAEGIETVIYLPYKAEPEVYVREELKPLYDLFKKSGDKSFVFELIFGSAAAYGDTPKTLSLKAIVNKTAEGLEFALVDASEAGDAEKSLAIYKNGALKVYGIDAAPLSELAGEALGGEGFVIDDDSIDAFFESLSGILDTCDSLVETPSVSTMIGFRKADGIYTISTDTQKLVAIAQLFLSGNENIGFDVNDVIDFIDGQFDGAVKAGDIKIDISLAIDGDGIVLGAALQNAITGGSFGITATLTVEDEALALPESPAPEVKDIEIEIPFAMPNGKIDIAVKAVVHLADILAASGNDYITASLSGNGKDNAGTFVLNDKYVYLDISGFSVYGGNDITFYKAFEVNGEPVSIFEYIKSMIFAQSDNNEDVPEDIPEGTDDENENGDENEFSYSGYGCTTVDGNGVAMLSIGATEEELRSQILFYIYDEDDNQIFKTDYQLVGFDSSASFHGYVDVLFYDIETSIEVVVRDAAAERCDGINIYPFRVGKGTDVATAQYYIPVEAEMTDGQVYWTIYDGECTIDKVDGVDVDAGYVFELIGNYTLTVTYKATGEQTEAALYVFDPDNLRVECVDFTPEIYVDQGTTEEELRNYISLRVEYDNGDFIFIEDYEIVDFTPGDEFVNICWNGDYYTIGIVYDDQPSGFDIADLANYLRVTDILASEDPIAAIKGLIEQNKELFKSVFVVDKEDKTLRVVINSKNGGDLVDVINIFFGIPGDEGFTDIDENYALDYLKSVADVFDIGSLFKIFTGVELSDFLTDLYFDVGVSSDNGIAVNIELGNGGEVKYFVTGCSVKLIDASVSNTVLTDEAIAAAKDFNTLSSAILALLMQMLFV